jgi:hypothetical protein
VQIRRIRWQREPVDFALGGGMAKGFSNVLAITLMLANCGFAYGKMLSKTAQSGKATLMYQYGNWKADCSTHGGVVKVLTRPQHGRLTPRREIVTIKASRFTGVTKCFGKQIQGFVVYYTSTPGFRGADNFAIEVSYPKFPTQIDTFTVAVE